MVKSNIYTRGGDKGQTSLVGGKRVSKTDSRLEAYGTIDELNAHISWLIQLIAPGSDRLLLEFIQHKLFTVGSHLATDVTFIELHEASKMKESDIKKLEQRIDEIDGKLPPLNRFVLPGGSLPGSAAHICRTICRRAERRICEVAEHSQVDEGIIRFINRLSDYLFVLARMQNIETDSNEIFWDKTC